MVELTKILHVEDDLEILQIAGMALEMLGGYTILQVDRGEKALAEVQAFAPQLILSDVQMPGMSGPETIEKIRKLPGLENIPAIFLTARLMSEAADLLVHPQDWEVISKPFDPISLSDQIREVWNARTTATAAQAR